MGRKIRDEFPVGEFVKSHYRSPWRGVVVGYLDVNVRGVEKRHRCGHTVLVLAPMFDRNGKLLGKAARQLRVLDPGWLTKTSPTEEQKMQIEAQAEATAQRTASFEASLSGEVK